MKNKILTAVLGIFIALFIITFSIGLPIYFRPFYYMQIESLGIPEMCGESYETIKDAYDEVLDYLTKFLPGTYDTVRPEGLPYVYAGVLMLMLIPVYFVTQKISTREK